MRGYKFNAYGELVTSNVYIVWGCPASGKTTYVKEHMVDGDMVVDLDNIKQSISMASKTEASDELLDTALSIREYLYKLIEDRDFKCNDVWVVAGLPTKDERIQLQERLDADLIQIRATYEECIQRAMKDVDRVDKKVQEMVIDRWHRLYYYE